MNLFTFELGSGYERLHTLLVREGWPINCQSAFTSLFFLIEVDWQSGGTPSRHYFIAAAPSGGVEYVYFSAK